MQVVGKNKSGKALFAWTNKLSKGKWSWFQGGGGGGSSGAATAAAGGGGAEAAGAESLLGLGLGLSGEPSPSHRGSSGSTGRVSGGGGRVSFSGAGGAVGPRSPNPGSLPFRDSLQLPPIEYWRKGGFGASTGPNSPMVVGGLEGEPGGFGAAAMARALYESGISMPARRA
jgi:hypothetical protein